MVIFVFVFIVLVILDLWFVPLFSRSQPFIVILALGLVVFCLFMCLHRWLVSLFASVPTLFLSSKTIFLSGPRFIYSLSISISFFFSTPLSIIFWSVSVNMVHESFPLSYFSVYFFSSVSPSPPSVPYLSLWLVESQELIPTGGAVSPGLTAVTGASHSFIFKAITFSSFQ